jgi:molecular chaperone DnaK
LIGWQEFKNEEGIDLRKDPMALQRLKEAAEKAKIELSSFFKQKLTCHTLQLLLDGPKHLVKNINKS